VVGGSVLAEGDSEGALMRGILEDEFAVPVEWVEDRSRNTAQNALQARKVLPVDRIVLVTHALHMRRAARQFEQAGFEVLPAPIQFVQRGHLDYVLFDWLPSIDAFAATYAALHEYLGLVWYRLRY
jgi:uncharacterized SAM-binding protein YcdF (DUF218 family)